MEGENEKLNTNKKYRFYDTNIFEYKRPYERMSEYIHIKKMIRTNIRIYSYQKKDTNMIRTNIRGGKYSNIFEYPNIRHTMFWRCLKA